MPSPSAVPPEDESHKVVVPSVVEAVVHGLRQLIMSGEVKPGDRLIEERLTERFGVSRPPLREALQILQRDGMVTSKPRRGFIVTPITADDIREIYTLRFALERPAVELGVPVTDPARLRPMRDALEQMRVAAKKNDQDAILAANGRFHYALILLAAHTRLARAYESLRMQLQFCMAYNLSFRQRLYSDPDDVVRRHEALLERIEHSDVEAVLHELRHHGDRAFLDNLEELIGPKP
jgi:DNA-binding GntR family transcriptional regulator